MEAKKMNAYEILAQRYSEYVKKCVAQNKKPLDPTDWMEVEAAVDEFRPPKLEVVQTQPKPEPKTEMAPARETEIRKAFTQMMIDQGVNNSMTLAQRARHYMALGYDARPATKKQTQPCALCGDILCAWAQ